MAKHCGAAPHPGPSQPAPRHTSMMHAAGHAGAVLLAHTNRPQAGSSSGCRAASGRHAPPRGSRCLRRTGRAADWLWITMHGSFSSRTGPGSCRHLPSPLALPAMLLAGKACAAPPQEHSVWALHLAAECACKPSTQVGSPPPDRQPMRSRCPCMHAPKSHERAQPSELLRLAQHAPRYLC